MDLLANLSLPLNQLPSEERLSSLGPVVLAVAVAAAVEVAVELHWVESPGLDSCLAAAAAVALADRFVPVQLENPS